MMPRGQVNSLFKGKKPLQEQNESLVKSICPWSSKFISGMYIGLRSVVCGLGYMGGHL